jgi:hypothetical protein
MKTLILRDELLKAAHHWPLIVGSFLIGSLGGLLVTFAWPSPYRANLELVVGLNPYRAYEDNYVAEIAEIPFRNADDYKYWQMQMLNTVVFSDEYLEQTLSNLMENDDYWENKSVEDLRSMLQVYWRNAGEWRLSAEASDPQHASQAVTIWQEVILDHTSSSITKAQDIYVLDQQMQTLQEMLFRDETRIEELSNISDTLNQWLGDMQSINQSEQLEILTRWWLFSLVSRSAEMDPAWQSLLDAFPSADAPLSEYDTWVEKTMTSIEIDMEQLSTRINNIENQHANLLDEWKIALQDSDGLAATLSVEKDDNSEPNIRKLRPVPLGALVGGLLGVLIWGGITLIQLSRGLSA